MGYRALLSARAFAENGMKSLRAALAVLAAAALLPAFAQVLPAHDYTDLWWNPGESGWGISIRQKPAAGGAVDALFAVWYAYDPRAADPASPAGAGNVPLWLVMPGGDWTSPTTYAGRMYVVAATPFQQPWNPAAHALQEVGTCQFRFTDAGHGVFTYSLAPPAGLPPTNPAFGLPAAAGSKAITRLAF